jgi:hypothetical protein
MLAIYILLGLVASQCTTICIPPPLVITVTASPSVPAPQVLIALPSSSDSFLTFAPSVSTVNQTMTMTDVVTDFVTAPTVSLTVTETDFVTVFVTLSVPALTQTVTDSLLSTVGSTVSVTMTLTDLLTETLFDLTSPTADSTQSSTATTPDVLLASPTFDCGCGAACNHTAGSPHDLAYHNTTLSNSTVVQTLVATV